ncbi:MAG TPA: hypothetical protein VM100_05430 [Longimicrobiales bacterium]|nr:hypothetical protein [Longimicrobiales bacterium]
MDLSARHRVLRTKVGEDGFLELVEMLDSGENEWKKDVLEIVTDRFERRLTEEIGVVRREITAVHVKIAEVQVEVAAGRISMIRWMFGFFLAQLSVTLSLMGMILRAAKLL